jgi:hypothetical protein
MAHFILEKGYKIKCKPINMEAFIYKLLIPKLQFTPLTKKYKKNAKVVPHATSTQRVSLTNVECTQKFQVCYELTCISLLRSVVAPLSLNATVYPVLLRWTHK